MNYYELAEELFNIMTQLPVDKQGGTYELSRGEMGTLRFLNNYNNGVTAGYLREIFNISSGRTADKLKSLEKKRLIERRKEEVDKRKVIVYITELGRNIVNKKEDNCVKGIVSLLEKLGIDDSIELLRIMEKIREIYEIEKYKSK